jgi:hypothetical protein
MDIWFLAIGGLCVLCENSSSPGTLAKVIDFLWTRGTHARVIAYGLWRNIEYYPILSGGARESTMQFILNAGVHQPDAFGAICKSMAETHASGGSTAFAAHMRQCADAALPCVYAKDCQSLFRIATLVTPIEDGLKDAFIDLMHQMIRNRADRMNMHRDYPNFQRYANDTADYEVWCSIVETASTTEESDLDDLDT